jgi:hypothetical protein
MASPPPGAALQGGPCTQSTYSTTLHLPSASRHQQGCGTRRMFYAARGQLGATTAAGAPFPAGAPLRFWCNPHTAGPCSRGRHQLALGPGCLLRTVCVCGLSVHTIHTDYHNHSGL